MVAFAPSGVFVVWVAVISVVMIHRNEPEPP